MDIEELHRVVVQGFASLNDKIDSGVGSLNDKFGLELASLNDKFGSELASLNDKIDSGLASLNDKVDSGFAAVNARFEHVDDELGRVKDALMEHGRQLKDIRAALDQKLDRDEVEARH